MDIDLLLGRQPHPGRLIRARARRLTDLDTPARPSHGPRCSRPNGGPTPHGHRSAGEFTAQLMPITTESGTHPTEPSPMTSAATGFSTDGHTDEKCEQSCTQSGCATRSESEQRAPGHGSRARWLPDPSRVSLRGHVPLGDRPPPRAELDECGPRGLRPQRARLADVGVGGRSGCRPRRGDRQRSRGPPGRFCSPSATADRCVEPATRATTVVVADPLPDRHASPPRFPTTHDARREPARCRLGLLGR